MAALLLACAGLAWPLVATLPEAVTRHPHDFLVYYAQARLLREGRGADRPYDFPSLPEEQRQLFTDIHDRDPYPPTTALLMLPLAGMDPAGALIAWTVIGLVLLAATVGVMARGLVLRGPWLLALVAAVLAWQPVLANFWHGQAYLLVLFLLAVAWRGWSSGNDALAGVALALLLVLKLAGGGIVLAAALFRRWRLLGWTAAAAGALVLGSLPWLGVRAWVAWPPVLAELATAPSHALAAFQTVPGLAAHLFTYDAVWNPAPLAAAPVVAAALSVAVPLLLIAATVLAFRGREEPDLAFAAFVVLGVVLNPLALDYHYAQLLLPIALVVAAVRDRGGALGLAAVLAAAVAIGADLPYRSPRLAGGALSLLAYPKLYGALLLLAAAVALALARAQRAPTPAPFPDLATPASPS